MSTIVKDAIKSAAEGFAVSPEDFENLKIKDSISSKNDWNEFNHRLCNKLKEHGCTTMEDQLDQFWENNKTFDEMIKYIDEDCGLS